MSTSPMSFMDTQAQISLFYWMREWTGLAFLVGLVTYIASFFVGGKEVQVKN